MLWPVSGPGSSADRGSVEKDQKEEGRASEKKRAKREKARASVCHRKEASKLLKCNCARGWACRLRKLFFHLTSLLSWHMNCKTNVQTHPPSTCSLDKKKYKSKPAQEGCRPDTLSANFMPEGS